VPLLDGQSFRDLVRWHETSLLWLAEAFIRTETAGPQCARLAETVLRLLEATGAEEVDLVGLGRPEAAVFARACTTRGVLVHGSVPQARPLRPPPSRRSGLRGALAGLWAPADPPPRPRPTVGTGSATALPLLVLPQRERDVAPLRPLLEAAADPLGAPVVTVAVEDLGRWETRRVRSAVSEAEARLRGCRDRLRDAPGLHESYAHRGVGFADLARNDLDRVLLGHLPAAVRRLETAVELLSAAPRPAVVLVPDAGWDDRRTLIAACARAGVPAAVVHSEPVGPEERDRSDRGPHPAVTLVWEPGSDPGPAVARLRGAVAL
jgi:hypothetical protein